MMMEKWLYNKSIEDMRGYKRALNRAFAEFNKAKTDEDRRHWIGEIAMLSSSIRLVAENAEDAMKKIG